ncbi:tetratricopeptide repeat protein [Pontiellaceae bacterium B12219]|nr:tetratricopeptide repeat protein [Pontiellaceae bacterium B12219]
MLYVYKKCERVLLLGALVGLAGLAFGQFPGRGVTQAQLSRMDPQAETTSVLIETSKELLKNEQYEDALPFLEEVLVRLEGDEGKKARQTRAFTLYQLGHCQMKLGDYVSGARNFVQFADEFPDDLQQESARMLAAQSLTMVQQWPLVEEQARLVLKNIRLSEELKIPSLQLLAEALYQQEKWAEAMKPLGLLLRTAKDAQVRAGAAVMLVTCYVRLDDFASLFEFLPKCEPSARFDVGLNVALLEAGDSHYNKGEYQKALLLYRLVLTKSDLTLHYENRIRELKLAMKPFAAGGAQTLSEYKEMQQKQEKLLARLRAQYEVITGFQDYDMDVVLRMAQCYSDLGRNWPAHAIYRRIFTENPESELADQACYSAFSVMLDEQEWALATAEGFDYIEKRPDGEYLDDITLNLIQLRLQQEQLEPAYEMGLQALELSPDHKYVDQVNYLLGYICFQRLEYGEALSFFTKILGAWPDSRYYESAEYWRAMSLLFLGDFEKAESAFLGYLSNPKYDEKVYGEDASYRLGIAQYGEEKFQASEETLRAFVADYPESSLLSEAYAMLGDLRGAEGELDVALDYYRLAMEKALSVVHLNYPLFQAAKTMELAKRYPELVVLMTDYLEEQGARGDFANAVYWRGKAYKALDEYPRALNSYFEAVDEFGNEAELDGIDVILNEIVSDYESEALEGYRSIILEDLDAHLEAAMSSGKRTLELRYKTIFANITTGEEREAFLDSIVRPESIPASGSSTLVVIAKEGVKRGEYELVQEAYDRFMSRYPISNQMLYIMNAQMDALIGRYRFDEAIALAEEILLKFGYSRSVAHARMRRGDAYRLKGDYENALGAYTEVLSIREWRGPLTPEALYYSGLCKMELGRVEEAFAYFQRIYVLYEEYAEWVAPAYDRSIQCMERLGGYNQEIINTCREMLANESVASTPEGLKAKRRLEESGVVEVGL